jgi:hypothetical protein
MPPCQSIREDLTAWIDGTLPSRRDERIRRHVAACTDCAAEAERLRAAIEWQQRTLPRVLALHDFDAQPLQERLQQAMALERHTEWEVSGWFLAVRFGLLRPFAVAGAAVTAVLLLLFFLGGPSAVLIPLGIESPPPAVARQPDLFKDYSLIQHLDALEYFDTVESTPLDDDQSTHNG